MKKIQKLIHQLLGIDAILTELREVNKKLTRVDQCVKSNHRTHGNRTFLSTGHWND